MGRRGAAAPGAGAARCWRRCAMAAITPQRAAAYARARGALPAFYAAYAAGEAAVRSWVADDEIALEDFALWLEDGV